MRVLQKRVKKFLSVILVAALAVTMLPGSFGTGTVQAAAGTGEIIVNPDTHYQTLEGWGTSLCWWGNIIGSWGETDYNGNGVPDREEIAELAFSPDYLNLNIVRYNVGGGDAPGHWEQGADSYHMKRVEGRVPGWTTDMGLNEDGTGTYDETLFLAKSLEEMNDAGQLWMLSQANKYRQPKNDIINEVFSNSPPYYMTESGCSSGNNDAGKDNLKADQVENFAAYMARAALWIDNYLGNTYGSSVSYIEPMNEPDTSYWGAGSTKQEGCHFDTGTSQSNMITAMQRALDSDGRLSGITIQATDETSLDKSINSYNKLSAEAKDNVSVIGAHTYGGNNTNRNDLRDLALAYDKGLWMSEVTKGGGTHNHDSMTETQTASLSSGIMSDLKIMQPTAWVAWLLADSEYECLKHNENWGPIHCVFEENGQPEASYHTNLVNADGTRKEGVPGEGEWYLTKQFYTMMQYTKYLKAGYTLVEIGDSNMVAAVSPDKKELVIVAQNNTGEERPVNLNLTRFTGADKVELYRTSNEETGTVQNNTTGDTTECCSKVDAVSLEDGSVVSTLPANSISTFVITNSGASELYTEKGYAQIINDQVVYQGEAAGQSKDNVNKFRYSENWVKETAGGSYGENVTATTTVGEKVTFTFQGERAVLLGQKLENGADITASVDGSVKEENISTAAASQQDNAVLFDTGKLADQVHTVELTVKEGTDIKLAVDGAKVITGDVDLFQAPSVMVSGHPNALKVSFGTATGAESYNVYYGTNAESMTKIEGAQSPAVIKNLENNTEYFVQVEAVKGSETVKTKIFKQTPGTEDENVLYYVDAGAGGIEYPTEGEVMGVYNSTMDQAFGEDQVSGKKWGYVESTSGGEAYATADYGRFMSVRYNNAKSNGSGIHYQFELEEGTYTVTVGCMDPWGNANRKQIINIQGEDKGEIFAPKKMENVASYKAEVTADHNGILDVAANIAATSNIDNSMLSWIRVEKYKPDKIVAVSEVQASTTMGTEPQLPATVETTTISGGTSTAAVSWNTKGISFDGNPYSLITVKGTVEGADIPAAASVQLIPEDVEYFIDCNNGDSPTLANVKGLNSTTLLNQDTADQAKTSENNWGYTGVIGNDINAFAGSAADPYSNGWYAGGNKNISYQLLLPEGAHEITMGCTGWWSMNRSMDVYYSYDGGEEVKLFDLDAVKSTPVYAGKKIVLAEEKLITLTVKKAASDDPILSWISVGKTEAQEAALTGLNVTFPDKTTYEYGEEFDSTGLKAEAVYADGTKKDVTSEVTITGFNSCKPGTQSVKISYGIQAKSFRVTIKENDSEITDNSWLVDSEILYAVNCGASDDTNTWQVYPGGSKGSRQSVADQAYAADGANSWGYTSAAPDSPLSAYKKTSAEESFWYMASSMQYDASKSGIKYDFDVEAGKKYLVTVGFYNPWAGKTEDVVLEGRTLGSALSVSKTTTVEKTYMVIPDDVLNLKVKTSGIRNSGDDDPILNYIIVREMPVYTLQMLQEKLTELEAATEGKTYGESSKVKFDAAVSQAKALITAGTAESEEILEAYRELVTAYNGLKETVVYNSIMGTDCDKARLVDNNGETIQAHGGQIQKWGDTWYWYGEDKSGGLAPVGVHLYTSTDLYNWKDEGLVLKTMESMDQFTTDAYFNSLYGSLSAKEQELVYRDIDMNTAVVERPKVIYNATTDKYIMWFHADGPYNGGDAHSYWKAMAGVAIADAPEGPFRFISAQRLHTSQDYDGEEKDYGMARDMNLFVDEGVDANGDGVDDAYIIYSSENNATMYISRLNADYTGLDKVQGEAVEGTDFSRNFAGASREAPAMFQYNGKYYLITSGCTGWNPNPAKYAMADSPLGPWTDMGDPCVGEGASTTFGTQSTCVIPVDPETGKYIYMGDRWYNPDNGKDVGDSRYVWLPIEFGNNYEMSLKDVSNWTLDKLGAKPGFEIANLDVLPKETANLDVYMEELPSTMLLQTGGNGQTQEAAVTWSSEKDASGLNATVTGTFTMEGEEQAFTFNVYICPQDLIYFIDSGTDESSSNPGSGYVEAAKEIGNIKNEVSDQKYDETNSWGYTNVTNKENESGGEIGYHGGSSMWETGWWAEAGKSITYRLKLPAGTFRVQSGYQEWWNASRSMRFQAGIVKEDNTVEALDSVDFAIDGSTKAGVQELNFKLEEEAVIQISVDKISGGDPVLSFLAVYHEEAVVLTGIQVTPPSKTEYKVGDESLDITGMAVTASYSDGAESDVTALAKISGFDTSSTGEKTITVSYKGEKGTFTILVVENKAALQKLYDDNKDTEKGIYTDESYDAFQAALNAAKTVLDNEGATQQEIDQAKSDLTDAISRLTVKEGIILKELAFTPPTRTQYVVSGNEELDLTGMQVIAVYDDGSRMDVTGQAVAGTWNKQMLGEQTIVVTYADVTAEFVITVVAADKTALQQVYNANKDKVQGNYTNESYAVFQEALQQAKAILENEIAGQAETDAAKRTLETAIAGLTAKPVQSLKGAVIKLSQTMYTYDGTQKKPGVTVILNNQTLNANDYTVTYGTNINAGAGTITVTGKGNYKDSRQVTFTIAKASFAKAAVTLGKTTYTYNGKAQKPSVKVVLAGKTLKSGTDYTVVYKNNINAGKAVVTITSKMGNYSGTVTKNFTIKKASKKITVKKTSISKTYGDKTFSLGVSTAKGEKLTYSLSSKSVVKVANGKAKILGCGKVTITIKSAASKNYNAASSKKITITVKPKKMSMYTPKSKKAGQMTVSWKKDTKASGYEISYATNSKFKKAKKTTVKSYRSTSKTISKLSKGKTYYVRIRSYKTVKGKKIYSSYSTVKKVKIKR